MPERTISPEFNLLVHHSKAPLRGFTESSIINAAAHMQRHAYYELGGKKQPLPDLEQLTCKYVRFYDGVITFVQNRLDGDLVGHGFLHPHWSSQRESRTAELALIYVDPQFRRQHLATVMTQQLCRTAKELQFNRILADVVTDSSGALLTKLGFQPRPNDPSEFMFLDL